MSSGVDSKSRHNVADTPSLPQLLLPFAHVIEGGLLSLMTSVAFSSSSAGLVRDRPSEQTTKMQHIKPGSKP